MCVRRENALRHASRLGVKVDSTWDGIYLASSRSAVELSKSVDTHKDHLSILDTGASKSVMGLAVARRIFRSLGQRLQLCRSNRRFRFGVTAHASLGSVTVHIPTPGGVLSI